MKVKVLSFVFLLAVLSANSQVVNQVVGSLGGNAVAAGYSLSFTVGEVAVSNQQSEQFAYREGFWFLNVDEALAPLGFDKQAILLYPNPTAGKLKISGIESVEQVKVYNATGQLLLQKPVRDREISLSDLASGVYHVQLLNEKEKPIHTQIIFKN